MATVSESIIKTLLEELKNIARTETVIGKEFQAGEFTLIPVSRVTLGASAGGCSGGLRPETKREGGGGGGGVKIDPIAFIAIKGGEISFHGIRKGGTLERVLERIPEIAEKIMEKIAEKRSQKRAAEREG